MLSILVVDDQAILRRGLRQILKEEVPALTLGEAADADEALRALAGRKWDLMLLDVSLPGRGGLDLLKEVRQQRRPPAVLMMSVYPEAQFAVRALKAGAAGGPP